MTNPRKDDLYSRATLAMMAAIVVVSIVVLWTQGRMWWCQSGDYAPWAWDIWSSHNSQHVLDPYSFTHILHGVLEFWLIGLVFWKVPMAWRFVVAILVESTWEVLENTSYMINRYREETISLNYFGDSIINSIADIFFCAMGFVVAGRVRLWWSVVLFVTTELVLLLTIRDSLILNLIMLLFPLESIRQWQTPV